MRHGTSMFGCFAAPAGGARARATLCAVALLACAGGPVEAAAQPPEPAVGALPFDCRAMLESAGKLETAARDMLAKLREQLGRAGTIRDALGPDVSEAALALLHDQERRLMATLLEAQSIRCPPAAGPSPEGAHRRDTGQD